MGIDGPVAGGEQFVQLDNGCLCCALNEDLEKDPCMNFVRAGALNHLVIETTGLADPLPVGWTFSRPGLSDFYRVDAIVVVVDAHNLDKVLEATPEARMQLERADILVINKLDLVQDEGAAVSATVREINTLAPILKSEQGKVPWSLLLTHDEPSRIFDRKESENPTSGHRHGGPSFETWTYRLAAEISDRALEDFLYELPDNVYRLKGLVQTDAEWDWTLVNAVAGRFDLRPIELADPPAQGGLVFIGPQLDREQLEKLCQTLNRAEKVAEASVPIRSRRKDRRR